MSSAVGTSQPKDSPVADVGPAELVRLPPLARVLKFWIIALLFLNTLLLFEFFSLDIKTGLAVLGGQKSTPINSLNDLVGAIFPFLFLGWLYVATRNLARNGSRLRFTPAAAIYSWLIPILFFWRPYQVVSQVWGATLHGTDWQAQKTPRRIKIWWASFWVALICVLIAVLAASELASSSASTPPDGGLALVALSYISAQVAGATSLVALYSIIGRVSAAHDDVSSKLVVAREPTSTLTPPVEPTAAITKAAASSAHAAPAASASSKSTWTKPGMAAAAALGFLLVARLFNNVSEPALNDAAAAQRCLQSVTIPREELSQKVGDGANREGGISWGCLTTSLLHQRSDMPCRTITSFH
jgi:Domain of unknown function (DUF4328)